MLVMRMSLLNLNKLMQFSVHLESEGEKFYRKWAEKTDDNILKSFFTVLSEEEKEHKKLFAKLAVKYKDPELGLEIDSEYSEYFEEFEKDIMFNNKDLKIIGNLKDAIEIAKKQELNTLLFYSDVRNRVLNEHRTAIDEIISEERRHFNKLDNLLKKLNKK